MPKRRHHYVPALITRNFCAIPRKIYLYDVLEKNITDSSPTDVFVRKKLYSLIDKDGEHDHDAAEDLFGTFENLGATSIKEIINNNRITYERKRNIATLWALQLLRTPSSRGHFEYMLKQIFMSTIKNLE